MEEYLIDEIDKNLRRNEDLRVKILMDIYRGQRLTEIGSDYPNSFRMVKKIKDLHINRDIDIGLWRNNPKGLLNNSFRLTQLNELLGVHHLKVAIFDNSLILTG